MQPADIHGETGHDTPADGPDMGHLRTRLVWVLSAILLVLILAFVPPLINVSRFRRRIASNLSNSLGRPVHLDRVSLNLLPLPGFTLENFVVNDDPAFGYEPILRANEVRATVRISSLWSHHVEFSRISLTEPTSLNLVRLPDGRWNFEPVLLQASRIEAAPTGQAYSGPAPRFPYIEASGARINLKLGQEKMPYALADSEFALWLPSPRQWHFRLEAHPARTDVAPSDAGVLRLEGTLGDSSAHAATLGEVPIDLHALWDAAPLAGLSRIAFGRDVGARGELTLDLHSLGTVESAQLAAIVSLAHGRRADFIPAQLLSLEAACKATASRQFQSYTGIECLWPQASATQREMVIVAGAVPDVREPVSASTELTFPALPAPILLQWLQAATPHPPTALTGPGVLSGEVAWHPARQPTWTGELKLSGESLQLPNGSSKPTALGDVILRSPVVAARRKGEPSGGSDKANLNTAGTGKANAAGTGKAMGAVAAFDLLPVTLSLGGKQPAILDGHFNVTGYTLHVTGSAVPRRLLELGDSIPQFGEGLRELLKSDSEDKAPVSPDDAQASVAGSAKPEENAVRVDLTATRRWGQPQTWVDNLGGAAKH
jgi:hypothetical protein